MGGEEVSVELEALLLKDKGHKVQSLIFDNKKITGFFSKIRFGLNSIYNFASARKLSNAIREFQPDIIHIHNIFFIASPSVLVIANRNKIPVVYTLHNYRLICANALMLREFQVCELCIKKKFPTAGIRHKCYRDSLSASALVTIITAVHKYFHTWKKKVTTFITLNDFARNKIINSSLEIPVSKAITKPNFVPDPGEGTYPREDFFLFAGRIAKEKGVHVLLKAFADMPDKKVIIIGDGPEKEKLMDQYNSYNNISFTGQLDKLEVEEYLKRCRAFICPSIWHEGTPLTIIEAFATGTPVIASRIDPTPESVKDGYNGILFSTLDATDLQLKVNLLEELTNADNLFYKNARQTYIEKFHPEIHYKAIMDIYEKAMVSLMPEKLNTLANHTDLSIS